MKSFILTSVCLVGTLLFAATAETRSEDFQAGNTTTPATASAPWSVVGSWSCTHPDWTGTLTLAADGTMSNADSTGHWTLTASHDHIILVLAWDTWPTETVTMINPDEFRARVRGQGQESDMVLRRMQPPTGQAVQ